MAIGASNWRGGMTDQRYFEMGAIPHTRQDGTETSLKCWASHCAECGRPFSFFTPGEAAKLQMNRRCHKHKRPGHRVKGGTS
jgi:hypothetical protein